MPNLNFMVAFQVIIPRRPVLLGRQCQRGRSWEEGTWGREELGRKEGGETNVMM